MTDGAAVTIFTITVVDKEGEKQGLYSVAVPDPYDLELQLKVGDPIDVSCMIRSVQHEPLRTRQSSGAQA